MNELVGKLCMVLFMGGDLGWCRMTVLAWESPMIKLKDEQWGASAWHNIQDIRTITRIGQKGKKP